MVVFTIRMDAHRRTEIVARNLRAAAAGTPVSALAQAADTDKETLTTRLAGRDEVTVADLIGVGGFFRIHPTEFLKGASL